MAIDEEKVRKIKAMLESLTNSQHADFLENTVKKIREHPEIHETLKKRLIKEFGWTQEDVDDLFQWVNENYQYGE